MSREFYLHLSSGSNEGYSETNADIINVLPHPIDVSGYEVALSSLHIPNNLQNVPPDDTTIGISVFNRDDRKQATITTSNKTVFEHINKSEIFSELNLKLKTGKHATADLVCFSKGIKDVFGIGVT